MDKVLIFDTTLRDGEQSPGATLNRTEKLQIAHALAKLNVDIIEAGFPYSSPGDFAAVEQIASEIADTTICALARATEADINTAYKALQKAKKPRIHTFIGSSDIHLEHKLRITKAQCLEKTAKMVGFAASLVSDIEFSPEDAGRADRHFLLELVQTAIQAGAKTINIPDTVGFITPDEFSSLIVFLKAQIDPQIVISVHCHNDLGLAVANSLAALSAGARQVECTINGLGERAGNCALEEIVMILKKRGDLLKLRSDVDSTQIARVSHLVSNLTGFAVQKNKAIVGANAFAHESGIHQDGVLKHRSTYEIIDPAEIGLKTNKLPLGPRSGKHALKNRLAELGYALTEDELELAYKAFKDLADKKKDVADRDLISLIDERQRETVTETFFSLESLLIACGSGLPTASVSLFRHEDKSSLRGSALGTGPVDAVYQAIKELVGIPNELIEFSVRSVTEGIDAQGEVTIRVQYQNRVFSGYGTDTDILKACAKAYLNALNRVCQLQATSTQVTEDQLVIGERV